MAEIYLLKNKANKKASVVVIKDKDGNLLLPIKQYRIYKSAFKRVKFE